MMKDDAAAIHEFLRAPGVVFDVRSPGEYSQGQIPGAVSLPLFTDTERALVGTEFKQVGKRQAVELGLKIVGPKLSDLASTAQRLSPDGNARIHCWRGGMRSSSMAWLLRTVGMSAVTLVGGYKSFRRWALEKIAEKRSVYLLGGLTGSGKTAVLHSLNKLGQQVLDLEAIARHRGSCYGSVGMQTQMSNEQFENDIAVQWASFDPARPVWIEDESRMIGRCCIPGALFDQMRTAPLFVIERSLSERLYILYDNYGKAESEELMVATQCLDKKLGKVRTKEAVGLIADGQIHEAMSIVLKYYDAAYQKNLNKLQKPLHRIAVEGLSDTEVAQKLLLEI